MIIPIITIVGIALLFFACVYCGNWYYDHKDNKPQQDRPRFEPIDTEPTRPLNYGFIPREFPRFKAVSTDPEALQSPKNRKNRKAMRAAKQRRLTLKRLPK